jgi:hypothetical protein
VSLSRRSFLLATGGACTALAGCDRIAVLRGAPLEERAFAAPSAETVDLAQHVLARCSFGPRPGDRAALLALAPDPDAAAAAWLERQLAPRAIDDEPAERAVRRCDSVDAPTGELFEYKPDVLLRELTAAALLRATYSKRQLYEVLVEFWSDHFNIDSSKAECAWLKTGDDREVIRKHALGRFSELLRASAFSPAMLWYLDGRANVKRSSEDGRTRTTRASCSSCTRSASTAATRQRDVMDAARCLTDGPCATATASARRASSSTRRARRRAEAGPRRRDPRGRARARRGDPARDGRGTSRHRGARRGEALQAVRGRRAAGRGGRSRRAAFRASRGDVATTLRALFARPEFRAARGVKLKRPFHYLVSILRATDATTDAGPR